MCAGPYDVRFLKESSFPNKVWELRKLIQRERVDLVHTTIFESDLAGRLAAYGSGVPVLTSLVNTSYETVRLTDPRVGRFKLYSAKVLDGWTGRHMTTHFHAITKAVKLAAVRSLRIPPERITVIERGRDPERLGEPSKARRQAARQRLDLPDDAELLLNVGRQEHQKGQRVLLEAVASLVPMRPRLKVLIAGRPGNASDELGCDLERFALTGKVKLLGHREDIPELLAAADVFVFPSLYEGLGGALIEAMGMGLPVVSTTIPAVREVVEEDHNALLVPSNSPESLARAIVRVLDDRTLAARMGQRSREIFLERFTLDKSVSRMIELYSRVVASNGDSARP